MRYDHRTIVTSWLVDHLKSFSGTFEERLKRFKEDHRAGSVHGYDSLYCESGGLYTTTPEKPATNIQLKTLNGNKALAKFAIDDIAKDAELLIDQQNLF